MERTYEINKPIIEGVDGVNAEYLYTLFLAIKCVNINYIRYTNHNENSKSSTATVESIKRSNAEISHVERVFAYELYRKWCDVDVIRNTPELVINAEIPKQLTDLLYDKGEHIYYPDMVLHSGQNNFKDNYIVCEIKRKEYVDSYPEKMNDDIKKLSVYVADETKKLIKEKEIDWNPYRLGVFLMTVREIKENKNETYSLDLIYKHLDKEILCLKENVAKKIVCVIYNGYELKYDTLFNLINRNK